jgi:hypothetical protein
MNTQLLDTPAAIAYLAERWGVRRAPRTWERWCANGTAPPCRWLGRYRMYKPSTLDNWVRAQLRDGRKRYG